MPKKGNIKVFIVCLVTFGIFFVGPIWLHYGWYRPMMQETSCSPNKAGICPGSGKPYVHSPTPPSRKKIKADKYKLTRTFILWCPTPCHKGQRNFGASMFLDDNEVSFYYQKMNYHQPDKRGPIAYVQKTVEFLTPKELTKETEYRKKMGLAPLSHDITGKRKVVYLPLSYYDSPEKK